MALTLSSANIVRLFHPLVNTLIKLQLNDGKLSTYVGHVFTEWNGHDGTRMDFSSFRRLKVLELPAKCFFQSSQAIPRHSIRKLLPRTLKKLKVLLSDDSLSLPELITTLTQNEYIDMV